MFVMPRTKHIASRILDFPLPFRPVMELKLSSLPVVRWSAQRRTKGLNIPSRYDCANGIRLEALHQSELLYPGQSSRTYVDDDFDDPHCA